MITHFVLVDFENVQPKSLGTLSPVDTHVRVFAGATQAKVDLSLAQALQPFGTSAEYIQIVGSGKDALDFHIAFYIGQLSAHHPDAQFTIVSKDTGFDPLIKHLGTRGVLCRRVSALPAPSKTAEERTPKQTSSQAKPETDKIKEVRARLERQKAARPRTVKTLQSSLKAWFKPALADEAVESLLADLQAKGFITVTGNKVSYSL